MRGLGFFALVMVGTHWELYLAASVGGIVWAGSIALSSAILADVRVRLVGLLYGLAYLGHQVGGMISSWLGGWAFERYGTHWIAFGAAGVLLLLAAGIALRLPQRGAPLAAAAAAAERSRLLSARRAFLQQRHQLGHVALAAALLDGLRIGVQHGLADVARRAGFLRHGVVVGQVLFRV